MEYEKNLSADGIFLTARTNSPATLSEADLSDLLHEMLVQITREIGAFVVSTALMLEVCCDTGRIIMAAEDGTRSGRIGCSVRLQCLQDVWYDLDESGVPADVFSKNIMSRVQEIGCIFHSLILRQKSAIFDRFETASFRLLVFGTASNTPVISEIIKNENGA